MPKCQECNTNFIPVDKFHPNQKYCSIECKNKAFMKVYLPRKRVYKAQYDTILYCKLCGKRIIFDKTKPINTQVIRKFCSVYCQEENNRILAKKRAYKKYSGLTQKQKKELRHSNYIKYKS